MSEIEKAFDFEGAAVRVHVSEGGEPLFVAKDVCDVLELSNPSVALGALDSDERSKLSLGRQGETNVVTESGLYHLIFKSRKAAAKKFRKWVTATVLPEIRRKGVYSVVRDADLMTLPSWLDAQQVDVSKEKEKAKRLLRRAWDASKLMGYKSQKVDSESGFVQFPHEVLEFAEEERAPELENSDWSLFQRIVRAMVVGREYRVMEIADLIALGGSDAKKLSSVGVLMKKFKGHTVDGFHVVSRKEQRRVIYSLEEVV